MVSKSLLLASAAFVAVRSETMVPPCEYVATLISEGAQAFPATKAFECLYTVPVNKEGNKKLIDELKIAWQWYGDISYLKNPPEGWEAIDLMAELDQIKNSLDNFTSEYEVQVAIQQIAVSTGDYQLHYFPDILQVFNFERDFSLVALSDDGLAVPKLYVTFDALKVADGNLTEDEISEVKTIDGEDAWPYLEKLTEFEEYMDLDSSLNNMLAKGDTLSPGSFMYSSHFDGPETNITFANGTEIMFMNSAWTNQDFKDVKDGKSFYDKFCTGKVFGVESNQSVQKRSISQGSAHHKREIVAGRHPEPVVSSQSGAVAGYFLEGEGYDDVAVLKILSFQPEGDEYGFEFQQVVSDFLKKSQEEGKNRLILDLRENSGGVIQIYVDLFMQLFPHRQAWQGAKYRATPYFKLMGDAFNEIYKNEDIQTYYKNTWNTTIEDELRFWAFPHFVDAQGNDWKDWEEFKGPEVFHDDQFTRTMRYSVSFSSPGINDVINAG